MLPGPLGSGAWAGTFVSAADFGVRDCDLRCGDTGRPVFGVWERPLGAAGGFGRSTLAAWSHPAHPSFACGGGGGADEAEPMDSDHFGRETHFG